MANVSAWTESIMFTLLFLTVIGIVLLGMNADYGKNYSLGITDNTTQQELINFMNTSESQIQGGDIDFGASSGIGLVSSFGLIRGAIRIVWSFISGGFIQNVMENLNLGASGTALGIALRIVWFLSLVFALLYALFKVKL